MWRRVPRRLVHVDLLMKNERRVRASNTVFRSVIGLINREGKSRILHANKARFKFA